MDGRLGAAGTGGKRRAVGRNRGGMAYDDRRTGARVQARLGRRTGKQTGKPTIKIEPKYAILARHVLFVHCRTPTCNRQTERRHKPLAKRRAGTTNAYVTNKSLQKST